MIRALLFDFDGLILDTETPEVEVLQEFFREHGQELPEEFWKNALGRGAEQIIETPMELLARLGGFDFDLDEKESERRRRTVERINQQPIRPGIVSLLEAARSAGLSIAAVSSSKHWWVDGHLARLGLSDFFSLTVCADDVERAKPFPDLYLLALSLLKLASTEAIALEDSPNGIAAANAAGIHVCAIPNTLSERLDLSSADRIIPRLDEVSLDNLLSA